MIHILHYPCLYYIAEKFGGGKVWQINRSANRLLIESTNLDGFSLANHEQFAKFAKLSCYTAAIALVLRYGT